MADNVHAGSNASTLPEIATDDVGGVHYQRVKLDVGGDGVSVPVVTALPVSNPGLGGGILQTITTVGATAAAVPATPLAGRATMLVQNVGATTIYLGTSTVTADTAATGGAQLLPGQSVPISLSSAVVLYAISSAAGGLVLTLELAA